MLHNKSQHRKLEGCALLEWPEAPRSRWRCSCSEACCSSALEMWRESLSAPADLVGPAPALPCCLLWLEEGSEPVDASPPLIVTRSPPSSSPDVPALWSSAAAQELSLNHRHIVSPQLDKVMEIPAADPSDRLYTFNNVDRVSGHAAHYTQSRPPQSYLRPAKASMPLQVCRTAAVCLKSPLSQEVTPELGLATDATSMTAGEAGPTSAMAWSLGEARFTMSARMRRPSGSSSICRRSPERTE